MPRRHKTRSAAGNTTGSTQHPSDILGTLSRLDANTVGEVLRAAQEAGVLAPLASTSRQLCTLARSGVPVSLDVSKPEHAALVLRSQAHGRPPFSGCVELRLAAGTLADCLMAAGILAAAHDWSALQRIQLMEALKQQALPPGHTVELCVVSLLTAMAPLQQLRDLELDLQLLGPCSAASVGHLVQLTRLRLSSDDAAGRGTDAESAGVRLDLGSWSRLTNLQELTLLGVAPVQPAASAAGPYCLPSSLTALTLDGLLQEDAFWTACWLTHLPGCPQLQRLRLDYTIRVEEVSSGHPEAVLQVLAQHNRRLSHLVIGYTDMGADINRAMGAQLEAWGIALHPEAEEWRPSAALSALTGLEHLNGDRQLRVRTLNDWQHLAQLTALTGLDGIQIHYAPPLQAGATLAALQLQGCGVGLGGRCLGRLLLACPHLHTIEVFISVPLAPAPAGPSEEQLRPHPTLKSVTIGACCHWALEATGAGAAAAGAAAVAAAQEAAEAAAAPAAAAAAQFAALAPVLAGVAKLDLSEWPAYGSSSSSSAKAICPNLSPCTALTELVFGCRPGLAGSAPLKQKRLLAMLAPLQQLQHLVVKHAPRLKARAVLELQHMLPQLHHVELIRCGKRLAHAEQQRQVRALRRVQQQLRPGLVLEVVDNIAQPSDGSSSDGEEQEEEEEEAQGSNVMGGAM